MSPDQSAPTPRLFLEPDGLIVVADDGQPVAQVILAHSEDWWGSAIVEAVNAHQRNADTIADLTRQLAEARETNQRLNREAQAAYSNGGKDMASKRNTGRMIERSAREAAEATIADLTAALREMLQMHTGEESRGGPWVECHARARAALAKAEGGGK